MHRRWKRVSQITSGISRKLSLCWTSRQTETLPLFPSKIADQATSRSLKVLFRSNLLDRHRVFGPARFSSQYDGFEGLCDDRRAERDIGAEIGELTVQSSDVKKA